jgi:hypothetical protein
MQLLSSFHRPVGLKTYPRWGSRLRLRLRDCLSWGPGLSELLPPIGGLDQFDLVAVGIFYECDFRSAEFHWPGLAYDFDAFLL